MDPVTATGTAASILQLAGTALTLSGSIMRFLSQINSAPRDMDRLRQGTALPLDIDYHVLGTKSQQRI